MSDVVLTRLDDGGAVPTATSALEVVDGEVRELIRRRGLDPFTDPNALTAALDQIRHTHVAWSLGEACEDVACLAVPVCSRAEAVVGAVCVAGPVSRADALTVHLDQAQGAARQLTCLIA